MPAALASYRARIESEAARVIDTAEGEDLTGQVEQIAIRAEWHRDGSYSQRIVGHRVRAAGPNVSVLSYLRRGWTAPVLYGERLRLLAYDSVGRARTERGFEAIRPFSEDRELLYRFEGGDTVAMLRLPERTVRVVRLRVEPRRMPERRTLAFHGDIDIDADRHEIIRMRGRLVRLRPDPGLIRPVLTAGSHALAYVELENAEYEGRFWLPYRQRIEFQATSFFTDSRAVMRIVSHFRDYRLNVPRTAVAGADGDSVGLVFAPWDTLESYGAALCLLASPADAVGLRPPPSPPSSRPRAIPSRRTRTVRGKGFGRRVCGPTGERSSRRRRREFATAAAPTGAERPRSTVAILDAVGADAHERCG